MKMAQPVSVSVLFILHLHIVFALYISLLAHKPTRKISKNFVSDREASWDSMVQEDYHCCLSSTARNLKGCGLAYEKRNELSPGSVSQHFKRKTICKSDLSERRKYLKQLVQTVKHSRILRHT